MRWTKRNPLDARRVPSATARGRFRRSLIGPEGGWTEEERSEFTAAKWDPSRWALRFYAPKPLRWPHSQW
jgi:16S rRNA U1498 N3-methylase RsmE